MRTTKLALGGLTTYVVHNLVADQRPELGVVLCHGYGAPGTDLVAIAQPLLSAAEEGGCRVVFLFPAAPLDLAEQGMPGGRAWWHIDLTRLLTRPTPQALAEFRRGCPAGLTNACDTLVALLADAGKTFGLTAERLLLGGFSQGAMLATDVALRLKNPPAALCIFSGALINESEWQRLAEERGPLTVLQSHGQYDSILPVAMGTALRDLLRSAGAELDFIAFPGDHEIPPAAIERLADMIVQKAGQRRA